MAVSANLVRIHSQQMQQLALGWSKTQRFIIHAYFVVQRVNMNRANSYGAGSLLPVRGSGSAADCMNMCQELSRVKRFSQVVIGTRFQAMNFILHIFSICYD